MTMPNFTIITPGGCNAKCDFCTDDMNRPASKDYILNLAKAISQLPAEYRQVSISGGEPTISPEFMTILWLIKASSRFDKVVLTTNGTKLHKYIDQLDGLVDHINLSRHAIGYDPNMRIFGTKAIPKDDEIVVMVDKLNRMGIDVNLNHVYSDADAHEVTERGDSYVTKFANYAKELGASSVAFRYDQNPNNLAETYLEREMFDLGYKIVNEGGCPSCRSHTHIVRGLPVMMKASLAEPKLVMGKEIYELIYHIDGRLCSDWAGDLEFDPKTGTVIERVKETQPASDVLQAVIENPIVATPTTTIIEKIQDKVERREIVKRDFHTSVVPDPSKVIVMGSCSGFGSFRCGS